MMLKTLLFVVAVTVQSMAIEDKLMADYELDSYPSAQGQRGDAPLSRTIWPYRQLSTPQSATPSPSTPQASWLQPFWPLSSWPASSWPQHPAPQPSWPQSYVPQPSWPQPSAPQPSWPQFSWPQPSRVQSTTTPAEKLKESVDIQLKVATIEQMVKESNDFLKKGTTENQATPSPCKNSEPSQQGCA